MHEVHWRLTRPAFENDGDAAFYFPSRAHDGALLKLRYVLEHRKGVGLLVGPHGTGKTFLLRRLVDELPQDGYTFVRIVYPKLGAAELLRDVSARLCGQPTPPETGAGLDSVLRSIEGRLAHLTAAGRHLVLIVDEAHLLDVEQLQALQLLLNLREAGRLELSLVLSGHVELLPRVRRIGGLDARVAARIALTPLSCEETAQYVRYRLQVAGREACPFSPSALRAIAELSQGIPRKINQVCDLALLIGYADELQELSPVDVEAAAAELAGACAA